MVALAHNPLAVSAPVAALLRQVRAMRAESGSVPVAICVNYRGAMELDRVFGLDVPEFDPLGVYDLQDRSLGMIHGAEVFYDRSLDAVTDPLMLARVMQAE